MKASCPTNGIGHDLEGERRERRVVVAPDARARASAVRHRAGDGGHVGRRRQVVDHGVDQRLHALVLEGAAAQHRHERRVLAAHGLDGPPAEDRDDLVGRDRLPVQVLLEQIGRRPRRPSRSTASRAAVASSRRLAGISSTADSAPSDSSWYRTAFIATRSITPAKPSSAPSGSWTATGFAWSFSRIWVERALRSRPRRGPSC